MMTRRTVGMLLLLLAGCGSNLGRLRVTVVFDAETRTQCIKATAKTASGVTVAANPPAIRRAGADSLLLGIGETSDLKGEIFVTISRFTSADCSGSSFASETKSAQLGTNGATGMLEFRFSDPAGDGGTDGGVDAGVDAGTDAGVDAGCNLTSCGNTPGDCEALPATGCAADGGCRFSFAAAQTPCGDGGVCNSMGACIANVCAVLPNGSQCNDGLTCTPTSTCSGTTCSGPCTGTTIPSCKRLRPGPVCDPNDATKCDLVPEADLTTCDGTGTCLAGECRRWFTFTVPPLNLRSTAATVTYPDAGWVLTSPDGGPCDTVISTGSGTPNVLQSDCGAPPIAASIDDAGVAVLTMLGLQVGPNARLSFVGTRPVQLLVLGNASINGTVSVAPLVGGQPAGNNPASCNAGAGMANKAGGGGGGFGGTGGTGGENGGAGGSSAPSTSPLRGGCSGGAGFRGSGTSAAGAGGGALELIVADTITLDGGIVTASGGGGEAGTADNEGGGGGGSGGLVIIEAQTVNLNNGAVTANGGGGGEGGDNGQMSASGAPGPINSATAAPAADNASSGGGIGGVGGVNSQPNGTGGGAASSSRGGGGGGGSAGAVYVRGQLSCTRGNGVISGAQPTSFSCP